MATTDPEVNAHLEWLGFVRPTGLVVSALALVKAGAILNRSDREGQELVRAQLTASLTSEAIPGYGPAAENPPHPLVAFRPFAESVLRWSFGSSDYAGTPEFPVPADLALRLPDSDELFRPTYAVRERNPSSPGTSNGDTEASPWQLLVSVMDHVDDPDTATDKKHGVSPHFQMERLLREARVPAGLLATRRGLRLMAAPRGESAGWLDFRFADMEQTAGRPIVAAMRLLLGEERLLSLPKDKRLPALLAASRAFQNQVSEELAVQVLHALYELLRGFQAADHASKGTLLHEYRTDAKSDLVYRGLLSVILRLVFLLYAEERDLLSQNATFLRSYSLLRLYERLQEDAAESPDTMDQRFGAWSQLVALFRLVHDGAAAGDLHLPARQGALFNPESYPFLEGRTSAHHSGTRLVAPLVSDGTIFRALQKLLVLNGERISYRALDVEQIGSVYETMMGFSLRRATGLSVAIKAEKAHGAPTTIDLEDLLTVRPKDRAAHITALTGRKVAPKAAAAVLASATTEDLHAALHPLIDHAATPDLVPKGAMILQPSEARRKSGSHYTPRELTEPIVRTTLAPLLDRLRKENRSPHPDQILSLKVCDPAMGSGAFLVETCRFLADTLVESWHAHGTLPDIPPDEDPIIFARRLVAQRCLYGVDRNPAATDLAKMSLWLATLAKDHALTFLDHALRHGDSLVGLSLHQIEHFHWDANSSTTQAGFETTHIRAAIERAYALRNQIRHADETVSDATLHQWWADATEALTDVRLTGDLAISIFFDSQKPKERELRRDALTVDINAGRLRTHQSALALRRRADPPFAPFHWEIEFPEVFDRQPSGFDAFVGNPPFGGHVTTLTSNLQSYTDWLREIHRESAGKCDLVAHFFRRSFNLLREGGTLGLIATNTIAQGDTRASGLRWICKHGGEIYDARRRVRWPGLAAVIVSVVHLSRGGVATRKHLDQQPIASITAFLGSGTTHDDPVRLPENAGKSFQGSIILGMGFTFDDTDKSGESSPLAEMERILKANPASREVILPYIGGSEVNTSPTHAHHRYVINFGERSEEECRRRWPELMAIVAAKVKLSRAQSSADSKSAHGRRAQVWWQHYHHAKQLYSASSGLDRVLAISSVGQHASFAHIPSTMVFSHALIIFPLPTYAAFCALQARPHELWARFFGSSLEDRLRYTPSDCFETFPFPEDFESHPALEAAGQSYYDFRADLMIKNDQGLTSTYNRFHDPSERDPAILELRRLHDLMDRSVLAAYGWTDLQPSLDFVLDYEEDEDSTSRKKKPYRYRWVDSFQEEVLARLLDLNASRSLTSSSPSRSPRPSRKPSPSTPSSPPDPSDFLPFS